MTFFPLFFGISLFEIIFCQIFKRQNNKKKRFKNLLFLIATKGTCILPIFAAIFAAMFVEEILVLELVKIGERLACKIY